MQRMTLTVAIILFNLSVFAQDKYWQQEVHYNIDVTLNDTKNTLSANALIEYINHSPDTLTFIWFHIWPNAYRNEKTALAQQLKSEKKRKKEEMGFIDSLRFTIGGKPIAVEPDAANIDVIKLLLPTPLLPGERTIIATPFFVKLPSYFSRFGHSEQQYMICQWYPKPAVYDRKGWHPMPYLDQGEFYSEFGSFRVSITLPSEYIVGATGSLQTADELEKYKSIGAANYQRRDTGYRVAYKTDKPGQRKTLVYTAQNVHDFAWFADKDFVIQYDTLKLSSGRVIDAFVWQQPNGNLQWKNSISFVEDAVTSYSSWLGEYPYPVVQAVEGPKNQSSGGMEYPMITLITSPEAGKEDLDAVITHEVGHNWFYGILATNERDHPWMDEGLNSYYQFRYEAQKYKGNTIFGDGIPVEMKTLSLSDFQGRVYNALNSMPFKKRIATASQDFSNKNDYGLVVYVKTAVWFFIIESSIGREKLDEAMKAYFEEWKFRHPYPEDLKAAIEKSTKLGMDELFDLLYKEGNFK
jgi:hypothetical protein